MAQPTVFDLRTASARRSKSLSSPPSRVSFARPQKPRSFLSVLNHIRRRVVSSFLSRPSPSRIPIPAPAIEPKVQTEMMIISRPMNAKVRTLVPRKVHYETVRRRQHREEPVLHTFQSTLTRSRRSKRPSTAPQLSSAKHFDGFVRRKEQKQAWSGEWNRTDIRDVINDLRSLR